LGAIISPSFYDKFDINEDGIVELNEIAAYESARILMGEYGTELDYKRAGNDLLRELTV